MTTEQLATFGSRCFFAGAGFFAVVETTARLLGWGALLTPLAGFAGGWLACRVIDRRAERIAPSRASTDTRPAA